MEGSGKTEWSRSGMAGRKGSLIQMQDRSISAVTFTSLNFLSYPLPTQQAEALVKSKQLKPSLALRTKPALLGVFGVLGAFPVGVPAGPQPHPATPSPNAPTLSFYLASSVGIQPLLSTPTCSFLTPGLVQTVDFRLLSCICPLESAVVSTEFPAPHVAHRRGSVHLSWRNSRRVVLTH